MTSVGCFEAKTHLPHLLEKVAKGERITITKHHIPIAMLVPFEGAQKQDPQAAIRELLAFRQRHPLKGLSIRHMIQEGRRF